MSEPSSAYGLWPLALINSAVFIVIALSFLKPNSRSDWRAPGKHAAFIAIMIGFLLQWPTLLTLVIFPVLVVSYIRLAQREELQAATAFANVWSNYARVTPAFIPKWSAEADRSVRTRRKASS
ncbi:MAG: hypothetical protein KF766_01520 [Rhodocyclaceae bacterium]|nr:hypothetical protein [Rhodocyclaceae bacterium]